MLAVIYCEQNLLFVHPDHLCFDRTTYDNINGPGGPFMFDIIGPAGPLMYPDQIFRYRSFSDVKHRYEKLYRLKIATVNPAPRNSRVWFTGNKQAA